jgi:hypothetical protein
MFFIKLIIFDFNQFLGDAKYFHSSYRNMIQLENFNSQ